MSKRFLYPEMIPLLILLLSTYSIHSVLCQDILIQERKLADLEVIRKLNYSNAAISMGPDLVFIDRGETFINPSQATVLKPIKFNSLKRDRSEIRRISKIHETCCHNITALYSTPDEQYLVMEGKTALFNNAKSICENVGLHLPEIRSPVDKWKLAEFMRRNSLQSVHAGIQFHIFSHQEKIDTFMFTSTSEHLDAEARSLNHICPEIKYNDVTYKYGTAWPGMFYDAYYDNYTPLSEVPLEYVYQAGHLLLCPNIGEKEPKSTGKSLKVVCQKEPVSNQDQKVKDLENLCYQRQKIIDSTVESLLSSITVIEKTFNTSTSSIPDDGLKPSLKVPTYKTEKKVDTPLVTPIYEMKGTNPHVSGIELAILNHYRNNDHLHKMPESDVIRKRTKRDLVSFASSVIAGISALVSIIIHLYEASKPAAPDFHPAVEALTLNSQYIVDEMNGLEQSLNEFITGEEQYLQYEHIESLIFTSFARMESNIQDNLLDMVNTLSNAANNLVTLRMVNHADLSRLETVISKETDDHLSPDISTYRVDPVFAEDTLYLAITIPIISESRKARILSIDPIPSFINGVKYLPDCSDSHIVIYEHSTTWSHITELETVQCLNRKQPCFIAGTKNQFTTTSCSSAQYFLQEHEIRLKPTTDMMPFVLSHNDTIIYSTPDEKHYRIQYHCPDVKSVGADKDTLINGKGFLYNRGMCKFEIPTAGISYTPATTFESLFRGQSVGTMFGGHGLNITVNPYPTIHRSGFNASQGHLNNLRKVPTVTRSTSTGFRWIDYVILGGLIIIIIVLVITCARKHLMKISAYLLPPWLVWIIDCCRKAQSADNTCHSNQNSSFSPLLRPPYNASHFERSTSDSPSQMASPFIDPRILQGIRQLPDSNLSGPYPPYFSTPINGASSTTLSGHDTTYTRATSTDETQNQTRTTTMPMQVTYSVRSSPDVKDTFESIPTTVTKLPSTEQQHSRTKVKDTIVHAGCKPKYAKTEIIHKVDENVMKMNHRGNSMHPNVQVSPRLAQDLEAASHVIAQNTKHMIDQTNQTLQESKM